MTQGQWITKSGGKTVEANKPCLKITVPRFDNSELIASYDKTLIGRCMNPQKQDMKVLLFMLPRIWQVEERVVGTDLGLGRFQFVFQEEEDITEVLKMEPFHFDYWMVSLVRWKPVLEVNYPSRINFWVRVMDIPLQFRAAQTFRSVGEAIGKVQGEVDMREGRVRVELDGFKPLVFSMAIEFEEGVEIMVSLRYEKLFGFCKECFCMTHDQSRCPKLQEEVKSGDKEIQGKTENGQQASSYKGAVTNGSGYEGSSRDAQHKAPSRSGNKGKGIARERPGPYQQAGNYQAYKERLPRGNGDGSSFRGRYYGNQAGRYVPQYPRNGEDGHQKLMMDAFKGGSRSSSQVAAQTSGVKKNGETPKACKALLFNEESENGVEKEAAAVEVLSKEQKEMANVQAQRVPAGMLVQDNEEKETYESNPLDDANLMVEGASLSDSDLLVDVVEDEYKEWEQGEITDFMEEEETMVQDKEAVGDIVDAQEHESGVDEMGEEERDNNDENREKAPKKKGGRPGPLAIGGSTKMRLVQGLVSPRKKNVAKTGGKIGDKGAGASKKATMKPKTSE
ncbi:hypothetical protein Rs2_35428 [Raphanus sativus]|uniref:Uncharacterized protein LOC108830589 n=1 Tax=Raphanus sativus TaxID=3726 RepID=A0A9W3C794_RAPSA|nr:uncharacterized protein LOC108830589 [Raphanus sativus]KAJ4885335.1 hypothetical protein Rs2_35428 [Raphanus sativus]